MKTAHMRAFVRGLRSNMDRSDVTQSGMMTRALRQREIPPDAELLHGVTGDDAY